MTDINNLNPDSIFNDVAEIFTDDYSLSPDPFFTDDEILEAFQSRIYKDLTFINKEHDENFNRKQAYATAAFKNYKRDLITMHINKIKELHNLKLTTRAADIFFIAYLNRSVGEKYLCQNFTSDYKKDIILTPAYKEKLNSIAAMHSEEVKNKLNALIAIYRITKIETIRP